MRISYIIFCFIFLSICSLHGQNEAPLDPDALYHQGAEAYRKGDFSQALKFAEVGLEAAPQYHDLRILKVLSQIGLSQFMEADREIEHLLHTAPVYPDLPPLLQQRLNIFQTPEQKLEFLDYIEKYIPFNLTLNIRKAEILAESGKQEEAGNLAKKLISEARLSPAETYALEKILSLGTSNEVGVSYQYINFGKSYSQNDSWHNLSTEYMRKFNRTQALARISLADGGYDRGMLYEIEAYPFLNDRFYAFVAAGVSNGKIFPDFKANLSLYYNFWKVFEGEVGGRLQAYESNNYFTAIAGLSLYQGNFYYNLRTFIGPERLEQLDQAYQANIRYYYKGADNYFFLKGGSGISPDERFLITRKLEQPGLKTYFGQAGVNFSLATYHLFQAGAGILQEEITGDNTGTQFLLNVSYRYRF
ncbi:MAG: YaiO family outer membrane beta-barrel protein [Salinimicrobium sediminis]|nr:YaiO family outer membrane beta-barrel protein [Salinimicrobium sediminis]